MTTAAVNPPDRLARRLASRNAETAGRLEPPVRAAAERTLPTAVPVATSASAPSPFDRALEIYKQGNASIAGAAEAAGTNRIAFERFLVDIHYPIPQQTVEEVLADIDRVERMLRAEGNWPSHARSL